MKELYDLKEMLCDELKEYGKKGELSTGSLDVVDKLSHALKSIETIIAMEEADGGNSNDYSRTYPYYRGTSYARGRSGGRRDSMGRYSRDDGYSGDVAEQLREIMDDAPNEHVRQEIQRLVSKLEKM